MLRRHIPWWVSGSQGALVVSQRDIKTLDVREYRPLGTPIEFRFYQRYANHPNRQSGIQFLTHYNTHQRFRVNKDFIDYMNWGREQGQARLPHRHQRVAFDFDDVLQPTRAEKASNGWFRDQDPTMGPHSDLSGAFDPYRKVFSMPEHWNKMFSTRRPGEGDIVHGVLPSQSLLGGLVTQSDTLGERSFGVETRGPIDGNVPGVNAPFLGEFDRKMMQAMSRPLNKERTITSNNGRFSNALYINDPERHQVLSTSLAKKLNLEIDRATNGVYSKLTVLEAAQSGLTDYFCGGLDLTSLGFDLQMASMVRAKAKKLTTSTDPKDQKEAQLLLGDATLYEDRADAMLREHAALIYRIYTAARPLMTLVNGKCRGTGCGVALFAKYCGLKDSSEFIVDGPNVGLTPFGGVTRLLARPETSHKYPGLAEFVMLTGTSLFSGDVLRLGWTDLFTSLSDMNYHIKEWFNNSEHMHNDAIAWQLGHLLETCFKMNDAHTSAMERCAITSVRARWIEDAFADQSSVKEILKTLGEIEKLPYTDTVYNTTDRCLATPFTIGSVEEGIEKLKQSFLKYSLDPWDVSAPEDEVAVCQAADIFTSYVLERRGNRDIVLNTRRHQLKQWKDQREREYHDYKNLRQAPHPRHVYARLEGCENKLVEFDFVFEPKVDKRAKKDGEEEISAMVMALKEKVCEALQMPANRDIEIGWYLPTLDTCPIYTDAELMDLLHADPGLQDPDVDLSFPPIYFVVKRNSLYFSEWAFAVKHQLLLQSPYALQASLELLNEVRGDGSEEDIKSLSDTLSIEYKYFARALRRPDFYQVGQHLDKSAEQWGEIKEELKRNLNQSVLPTRPLPQFEEVFERNVDLDGHHFPLRPRWEPRTVQEGEFTKEQLEQLRAPLDFAKEGLINFDAALYCSKDSRLDGMLDDIGGYELVSHLGEVNSEGKPMVEPLKDNAHVPVVNFYEMARHPWDDTPSSYRKDGYTKGSQEYFEQQYKSAERALYDEGSRGAYNYWPSKSAAEGTDEDTGRALLDERLFGEIKRQENQLEGWARELRKKAVTNNLDYKMEIATQEEKIYDDEYYRWFIQPGQNPNPSGMLLGKKSAASRSQEDVELDAMLDNLLSSARGSTPEFVEEPDKDVSEVDAEAVSEETDNE